METLEKNYFNLFLEFLAEFEVTCLKVALSNSYNVPGVLHLIEAARGAEYIRANYPNASPV